MTQQAPVQLSAAPPPPPAAASALTKGTPLPSEQLNALRARIGNSVELTVVPPLQEFVETALVQTQLPGAVIAINPSVGSVLALASVSGDRGDPLTTPHMPASTIKSFVAIAALRTGTIQPDSTFTCTSQYAFAGKQLTCPSAHGPENVVRALAASCNAFFYDLATKLAPSVIADVAREFGLDSLSEIELREQPGFIPNPVNASSRPIQPLLDAIGHGEYRVTLLALARAYAAIANGGTLPALHVAKAQWPPNSQDTHSTPKGRLLGIDPAILGAIRTGLAQAVSTDFGRSHALTIDGFPFAGKTGGSDSPPRTPSAIDSNEQDTWFVAYAPAESPTILIAARLERASHGETAAKLVANILANTRGIVGKPTPQ